MTTTGIRIGKILGSLIGGVFVGILIEKLEKNKWR